MKLYDVKQRSGIKVRVVGDVGVPPHHRGILDDEIFTFSHIDGMYSYCSDSNGNPVHLMASTEVEIVFI